MIGDVDDHQWVQLERQSAARRFRHSDDDSPISVGFLLSDTSAISLSLSPPYSFLLSLKLLGPAQTMKPIIYDMFGIASTLLHKTRLFTKSQVMSAFMRSVFTKRILRF